MDDRLHTTELGGPGSDDGGGSRVVFCHGLFGQGRNFTAIGKALAADHRVTLVDMPDHGQSPWSMRFDYLAAAEQVADLLDADDPVALVGHSMGGKIAMLAALRHPDRVERLVVVDVSPVPYDHATEFERYLGAMRAIDLDSLASRAEADAALVEAVPDPTVRGFLLQSLRRESAADGGGWRWYLNLELLQRDLDAITDWPGDALAGTPPYDGPVLWIGGGDSRYVHPEYVAAMDRWFPRNRRVTIKGAGHWVHSEQPEVFIEVLRRFLV
ncbi:MAG TPA: alpha/beta fold hydrolase [Nocardioides sp.]|nr:alpha/beta fold hydrolase [Nocardioides sp.]HRI94691.1 alpha/beta fold hydrolase [Nocardioides sp.]HRK44500.1 alpha/beta fold hydrolase [Nocardioides sp.]